MVRKETFFEFKRELMRGNLITWFVLFLIIFIMCEVIQTGVLVSGGG